jgi:hypothetical protein
MIQAISQLRSSESSSFGSYLAELVGFESIKPKKSKHKLNVELLLDNYQSLLEKKINQSYSWKEFKDYLIVDLNEDNQVVIYIEAPDYISDEINLLEFGTPGRGPDALIRVSEAEFNNDFQSKRMFSL